MNRLHSVANALESQWHALRLLVVGDVMLDQYIWGDVARVSPEAPVPVVHATRRSDQPGGAANVAVNLARLGAQAEVVGLVGEDESALRLRQSLAAHGVSAHCITVRDHITTSKLRILGGNQQMLRLDHERPAALPAQVLRQLVEAARTRLADCHALILSDYAKGALTADVCQELIQAARQFDLPVVVDPKSSDFTRYRGATAICPNLRELRAAVRAAFPGNAPLNHAGVEDDESINSLLARGASLVSQLGLDFLVATLSEKGIALLGPGVRFLAPATARQVFDVSGAGDTVVAVLALSLADGIEPETAVELANLAAGIVVGKAGTAPIERHELLAALHPEIALHSEEKVLSLSDLLVRVSLWRDHGERVVVTNGCFDLLHVGHIALLEQARRYGHRLIVALNSDSSVRALKGPARPVVGERERARVLAALAAVDAVVFFSESTPLELIRALRPDVLVKGGDYSSTSVVGAAEVAGWGGEVRIVPTVAGFSTSQLIARSAAMR